MVVRKRRGIRRRLTVLSSAVGASSEFVVGLWRSESDKRWLIPLVVFLCFFGLILIVATTVQALALNEATVPRGAFLSFAYALGLGVPFIVTGLLFRRAMGSFAWVRAHYALVMRVGGGLLVAVGVLMATGLYADLTLELQQWAARYETSI